TELGAVVGGCGDSVGAVATWSGVETLLATSVAEVELVGTTRACDASGPPIQNHAASPVKPANPAAARRTWLGRTRAAYLSTVLHHVERVGKESFRRPLGSSRSSGGTRANSGASRNAALPLRSRERSFANDAPAEA